MAKATYAIRVTDGYTGAVKERSGTLDELTQSFSFTLEMGKRYDGGIDTTPKTAQNLVENLQKAAAVDMLNKRYEFVGETKRVPYWNWKNCFPECATVKGSYDAKRGTIEMVLPDVYVTLHTGYGPAARDKAIIKARELAETGLYNL